MFGLLLLFPSDRFRFWLMRHFLDLEQSIDAVRRMSSHAVLLEVALGLWPKRLIDVVRIATTATARLSDASDEEALMTLARDTQLEEVVRCAMGGIKSQTNLARLGSTPKEAVQREVAKRLLGDAALLEFAQRSKYPSVQQEIASRLVDDSALSEFALKTTYGSAGKCAAERVSDPTALAQLTCYASTSEVRFAAFERVTGQAALLGIAYTSPDTALRQQAVKRLDGTDQRSLFELATGSPDAAVQLLAVGRLEDQTLLVEIARLGEGGIAEAAATRIVATRPGSGVYEDLVEQARSDAVRSIALEQVKNQPLLAKLAQNPSAKEAMRLRAVEKLKHAALILQTAQHADSDKVAEAAARKIADRKGCEEVARRAMSDAARRVALDNVEDQHLLADVALESAALAVTALCKVKDDAVLVKVLAQLGTRGDDWVEARRHVVSRLANKRGRQVERVLLNYCVARATKEGRSRVKYVPYPVLPATPSVVNELLGLLRANNLAVRKLATKALLSVGLRKNTLHELVVRDAARPGREEAQAVLDVWDNAGRLAFIDLRGRRDWGYKAWCY